MPSLLARCRSAPTVRFVGIEILATDVFVFECLRSSASFVFDQATCLLFAFLAITTSLFVWRARGVAHPFSKHNPELLDSLPASPKQNCFNNSSVLTYKDPAAVALLTPNS